MKYRALVLVLALGFAGCAHHKDVRPGVDGVNRVVISTDDPEGATRDAISQANNYCEEKHKEAAFITEDKKYTGDMKEQDYKNAKRATAVAKTVGGAVYVLGGHRESSAGGLIGLGGVAGDAALGKGYSVEMRFRCQ